MLIPTILSGGAGTRLWPLSRQAHPKPFIRLPDGQTLLHKTLLRGARLPGVAELLIVTNRDHYFQTHDECAAAGLSRLPTRYLLEPCGRSTAPALALAALDIEQRHGPSACMLVLPADHIVQDEIAFAQAVAQAQAIAQQGWLTTFGIQPTHPHTGYGYIEVGQPLHGGHRVARFVEKPDAQRAADMLASGRHLWNSGMFCWRVCDLLDAMQLTCPDVLQAARDCWAQADVQTNPVQWPPAAFEALPDISIDYALLEKAPQLAVVPCQLGWSDVGSWNALAELLPTDADGNRAQGDVMLLNSHNNIVIGGHHLLATLGVRDLIIVDTPDATLVAHRDQAEDVRRIVQRLRDSGHSGYRWHATVHRPWGSYTVLEEGPRFKIKRIVVKPGASLSLQMHRHRSEHWIVVSGVAKVINGQQELLVRTNESTYIPAGQKHRLENPGKVELVMIEVQSGEYLGEDDIVRFEDAYGRC